MFLNLLILTFSLSCFFSRAQEVRLLGMGFYNVENLFDPSDDPNTFDEDFTPEGRLHWTHQKLKKKLEQVSKVIADMGKESQLAGLSLLGLCEIENKTVLQLLVQSQNLLALDYGFIHFDGPDSRGIDVALLYRKKHFSPVSVNHYRLRIKNEKQFPIATREQLIVQGQLLGKTVTVLVNHWPSRRGGVKKSAPLRAAAARLQQRILDSVFSEDPHARVVVMGDFNDNPDDPSVKLLTQANSYYPNFQALHNPMHPFHKKGLGSLAHRDQWFLFDQLLLSPAWYNNKDFFFFKAEIFDPPWLYNPSGKYKGYPFRTQHQGNYISGFSDHFPVYALFVLRE